MNFLSNLLAALTSNNPINTLATVLCTIVCLVLRQVFRQIRDSNARIDRLEAEFRVSQQAKSHLERIADRVCYGYEWLLGRVLIVTPLLRSGRPIAEELIQELETAPSVRELIEGPLGTAGAIPITK